jgi:NTE family protein
MVGRLAFSQPLWAGKLSTTCWFYISPKRLIGQIFTLENYEAIRQKGTDVIVTVSNLTLEKVEHKSIKECSYEDFCDWMWISANMIPFMSLVQKDGYEYADGGIGNRVPVREAIKKGATQVDVIVLQPKAPLKNHPPPGNMFSLLLTMIGFMHSQLGLNDITIRLVRP